MKKNLQKQLIQTISFNRFVFRLPYTDRIFLTFDDGPHPVYTKEVLRILDDFQAPSTFFLIGENAKIYSDMAVMIQNHGHTIGLHTYHHQNLDRMTRAEFEKDLVACQTLLQQILGQTLRLLRPPEGRIQFIHLYWIILNRITLVHYTITSNDWKAKGVSDILSSIQVDEITGGEILSFHDNNPITVEALPILLESLKAKGFSFSPITVKRD